MPSSFGSRREGFGSNTGRPPHRKANLAAGVEFPDCSKKQKAGLKAGRKPAFCITARLISALGYHLVLRQLEGPDHATLVEVLHPLGHFATPQWNGATPAGEHGNVLLSVHFPGYRGADDARAGVELIEFLTRLGIEGHQVAFRVTGEYQIALGSQHATPKRRVVLVAPDFLAGLRINGAQNADIFLVERLNGEAGTQIRRAFLVGDGFVPDIHAPLVARHIEQAGILAIRHGHPVFGAEEGRRYKYRFALFSTRRARTVVVDVDRTTVLVEALGPGDLVNKREATDELAVGPVEHIEETVTVRGSSGLDGLATFLVVEGNQLVDAVKVPAVMRGGLEVPFDRTVIRVQCQTGRRVQVIAGAQVRV